MSVAAHHPAASGPARSWLAAVRRFRADVLTVAGGAVREAFLYLGGSEQSHIRQRERLVELDDRMLRDIGLARRDRRPRDQ
jgi:uncharacterized protein YjiS (DUF1127 family)